MHAGLAHDWDRSDSLAVILFEIKPSGDLGECILMCLCMFVPHLLSNASSTAPN
jgi:hypothetical protein